MLDFDTANDYSRQDAELLEDYIRTGDASSFGTLYTRYMPLVYGLCLKYLGNAQDAEDAVMQIFEDLLPKIARYEIKDFRTWLWSVARNHCLQHLRREKKKINVGFGENFMETVPLVHLLSEGTDEQALAALADCMEKLPDGQREAIRMFFMERMSYADIAASELYEAKGVKGVKSHIQNGKRNLRACIQRHGVKL